MNELQYYVLIGYMTIAAGLKELKSESADSANYYETYWPYLKPEEARKQDSITIEKWLYESNKEKYYKGKVLTLTYREQVIKEIKRVNK